MHKLFTVLLLAFSCSVSYCQSQIGQSEATFGWQIKQVDEFIERFNYSDTSIINAYNNKHAPSAALTREKLLLSLFDSENKKWNFDELKNFISDVTNKDNPQYLDFFDKDWCAKINCTLTWKGKPGNAVLTLKTQKLADESSKWVICGVDAKFLRAQRLRDSSANRFITVPAAEDSTTSLQPFSHATSFMNIDEVSKDKVNIKNYFTQPANPFNDELLVFMDEIINNRLFINKTTAVNYYFSQIKGWVFEVKDFNRQARNSGWLISKLTKVPEQIAQR